MIGKKITIKFLWKGIAYVIKEFAQPIKGKAFKRVSKRQTMKWLFFSKMVKILESLNAISYLKQYQKNKKLPVVSR